MLSNIHHVRQMVTAKLIKIQLIEIRGGIDGSIPIYCTGRIKPLFYNRTALQLSTLEWVWVTQ